MYKSCEPHVKRHRYIRRAVIYVFFLFFFLRTSFSFVNPLPFYNIMCVLLVWRRRLYIPEGDDKIKIFEKKRKKRLRKTGLSVNPGACIRAAVVFFFIFRARALFVGAVYNARVLIFFTNTVVDRPVNRGAINFRIIPLYTLAHIRGHVR